MGNFSKKYILSFFVSAYFFSLQTALAAGVLETGGLRDPLQDQTFLQLVQRIIGYLIKLGAPIVALMVLYGGFLILTAGDKPDQVISGRKTIMWAAIGYAVIICSWGVIYIIQEALGAKLI
ncbi:MAG: hypothetical protein AAB596_00495 [Patescibacteria group bacterium]